MDNNDSANSEREDEQWLEAIAGRPNPNADAKLNREASALRAALLARRQNMESSVPTADDALLEQILFRLRREGLDRSESDPSEKPTAIWRNSRRSLNVRSDKLPDFLREDPSQIEKPNQRPWNYRAWGMAASVLIGIALIVQLGIKPHRSSEDDVVRGDSATTILIVDDPQSRLAELLTGLRVAGVEPKVTQVKDGGVLIKIPANDASREYLSSQRIEGKEKDGEIVLLLSKKLAK
jgi:hypothetical protein